MNISFKIIFFLIILILLYFINLYYSKDQITLKIFRNSHPWARGFVKQSEKPIRLEFKTKTINNKTIASIIVTKTVMKLENKLNLSKLLINKPYYPETYIYDRYHNELPKNDDIWFIKECNYSTYGGFGVNAVNKVDQIKKYFYPGKKYIIQRSIKNMYLYDGKKGDVRVYYLTIFYKNKLQFYLYKDGMIKKAKENYNSKNMDINIQITNTSQIKKGDKPQSFIFDKSFVHYNIFIKKIKYVLKDVSVEISKQFPSDYESSYPLEFQLSGPDFIFDNYYNPYLLELNCGFPAYITNSDNNIKKMKRNIAKIISNNLLHPSINGDSIDLESHGFIKL